MRDTMLFALLDPMLVPRYFLPFYHSKRIQEAIDVICFRGGGRPRRLAFLTELMC